MADWLTLFQTVLYGCTFILGFMVSIPVGVTQVVVQLICSFCRCLGPAPNLVKAKFEGFCILYGKPKGWIEDNASCDFAIAFSVIALIIYSLACAAYHGFCFWKSRQDKSISLSIWNIPFLGLNAALTVILLVMACMLSVGYSHFCNEFDDPHSCKTAQDTWSWFYKMEQIYPGKFHDRMTLAIASSWIAFVVYLGQVGLGVLRIRRKAHLKQSKSEEAKTAPAKSAI